MQASDFEWTIRVYYEDTDAGGIVFYANYLKYFERARTEWLRACGVHQQALKEALGAMFVVSEVNLRYHAPAQLDDVLKLTLSIEKLGRASVQFLQQAWKGDTLLTSAEVKVGCVDSQTLRPRPLPEPIAAQMRATVQTPA